MPSEQLFDISEQFRKSGNSTEMCLICLDVTDFHMYRIYKDKNTDFEDEKDTILVEEELISKNDVCALLAKRNQVHAGGTSCIDDIINAILEAGINIKQSDIAKAVIDCSYGDVWDKKCYRGKDTDYIVRKLDISGLGTVTI